MSIRISIMESPEIIVIGAGPSGIALAHTLKHKLGFNDFTVSNYKGSVKQPANPRRHEIVLRQT